MSNLLVGLGGTAAGTGTESGTPHSIVDITDEHHPPALAAANLGFGYLNHEWTGNLWFVLERLHAVTPAEGEAEAYTNSAYRGVHNSNYNVNVGAIDDFYYDRQRNVWREKELSVDSALHVRYNWGVVHFTNIAGHSDDHWLGRHYNANEAAAAVSGTYDSTEAYVYYDRIHDEVRQLNSYTAPSTPYSTYELIDIIGSLVSPEHQGFLAALMATGHHSNTSYRPFGIEAPIERTAVNDALAGLSIYDDTVYAITETGWANQTRITTTHHIDGGAVRVGDPADEEFWVIGNEDGLVLLEDFGGFEEVDGGGATDVGISLAHDPDANDFFIQLVVDDDNSQLQVLFWEYDPATPEIIKNHTINLSAASIATATGLTATEAMDLAASITWQEGDKIHIAWGPVENDELEVPYTLTSGWDLAGTGNTRTLTHDSESIERIEVAQKPVGLHISDDLIFLAVPYAIYEWEHERGGELVDVSAEHSTPTPSADTARDWYFDQTQTPPRIWVPHEHAAPDTAPSLTFTNVVPSGLNRGVHYVNPSSPVDGDWYYNRNNHSWRYKPAGQTHFNSISFTELKMVAYLSSADTELYFNDDDVFLNEVRSSDQAAQIIENAGNYDSGKEYFYIQGSNFRQVDVFTAAVTNRVVRDYATMRIEDSFHGEVMHLDTADYTWAQGAMRGVALSRTIMEEERNREWEVRFEDDSSSTFSITTPVTIGDWLDLPAKADDDFDSSDTIAFPMKNLHVDTITSNSIMSVFIARRDNTTLLIFPNLAGNNIIDWRLRVRLV